MKPTHSNMYIHAYSSPSENIKLGTIVSLFLRACRNCDHQFIRQEINFIFDIFYQLGYNRQFNEKARFKARNIHYKQERKEKEEYDRILVLPSICEKTRTKKLLPPKTKVVYNSTTTIKSYLRNSVTKGYSIGNQVFTRCLVQHVTNNT